MLFKIKELQKINIYSAGYFGFIFVLLVSSIYLLLQVYFKSQVYEEVNLRLSYLHEKALSSKLQKEKERFLLEKLEQADRFYIDKHLETLTFLQTEIDKLKILDFHSAEDESLKNRLRFLENSNKLLFKETAIRTSKGFREIEEKQQGEIEINTEDLKQLLSFIEEKEIPPYFPPNGAPQLIITDFQLVKKRSSSQEEIYSLSTQLIKRESNVKNE